MRILHISDNYPPGIGGLERSVQTLARKQASRGDTVLVLTAHRNGSPRRELDEGVEIVRIKMSLQYLPNVFDDPSARVFFPPVEDPYAASKCGAVLGRFAPDIIHSHGWILFTCIRSALKRGIPIVNTAHDYGAACATKSLFKKGAVCPGPALSRCLACCASHYGPKGVPVSLALRYASRINRKVDVWTGLSTAVMEAGSAPRPKDRSAIHVIPSYVPDSVVEIQDQALRPEFVPDGQYLFYAGALSEAKGVNVLLDAHTRLCSQGYTLPLIIAGVPQQDARLDLERPLVTVIRGVAHEKVMAAWTHARVGIIPSVWPEPFGQVAVECLASGTAVVVTSAGGLPDIVEDEVSGLVVDPGNADALASGVRRLLDDSVLSTRLGAAGRLRARKFTISAVLPQIDAAYRLALSGYGEMNRRRRAETVPPSGLTGSGEIEGSVSSFGAC